MVICCWCCCYFTCKFESLSCSRRQRSPDRRNGAQHQQHLCTVHSERSGWLSALNVTVAATSPSATWNNLLIILAFSFAPSLIASPSTWTQRTGTHSRSARQMGSNRRRNLGQNHRVRGQSACGQSLCPRANPDNQQFR